MELAMGWNDCFTFCETLFEQLFEHGDTDIRCRLLRHGYSRSLSMPELRTGFTKPISPFIIPSFFFRIIDTQKPVIAQFINVMGQLVLIGNEISTRDECDFEGCGRNVSKSELYMTEDLLYKKL